MSEELTGPSKRRAKRPRTIAVQPVAKLDPDINVTPLVDVVLVLLIIFMVMTPLVESDLGVYLSAEKRTTKSSEVAANQVVVSVQGNGGLSINSQPVDQGDYVTKLKGLLEGRSQEDAVVFVVAGDNADYPSLVGAIDRAKQAGASTVGLALDQPPSEAAASAPGAAAPAAPEAPPAAAPSEAPAAPSAETP